MKRSLRTISLQLLVAITISVSILILSGIFIYKSFRSSEKNIMEATAVTAKYVSDAANLSVRSPIVPSQIALGLIGHDHITVAKTLEERLHSLPIFAEVLNTNALYRAIHIGYGNGEFFSLRRAQAENRPGINMLPEEFHFLALSRVLNNNETYTDDLRFYDANLNLLKHRIQNGYNPDPRTRPWFKNAIESNTFELTKPYVFYSTQDIGLTISHRAARSDAVLGIDVVISDISKFLANLRITPQTEIAIIDEEQNIIAYHDMERFFAEGKNFEISTLSSLNVPILSQIMVNSPPQNEITLFENQGKKWYGVISPLTYVTKNQLKLLIAIPAHELLANVWANLYSQVLMAFAIMIVLSTVGWFLGRRIVQPLQNLAKQVRSLANFDFSKQIGVSTALREVRDLGETLSSMTTTIQSFLQISLILNKEQNLELMLSLVLEQLLEMVHLTQGAIYLYDEKTEILKLAVVHGNQYPSEIVLSAHTLSDYDLARHIQAHKDSEEIIVALRNRENELVGVLSILSETSNNHLSDNKFTQFVESISNAAAVAIETRQLILAQKALLEAIIKLIADAIDAKSLYTGGHCRRVPEFALMIMEQVKKSQNPAFVGFELSKEQEEEFRVAAWLHDCGKIITPEYIADKATKLEMIYNRMHEIRMRFEVLHRDTTIECLQAIANGADPEQAKRACDEEQKRLQEDFAFIGHCNIGGESMGDRDIERLYQIGQRTWLRYFDKHLGISHNELIHMPPMTGPELLPVKETLLSDKPEHIIHWDDKHIPPVQAEDPRNIWGFNMHVPQYKYNFGELYNLSIRKGTITEEERFKINEHVVQTICMLSSLPLPKTLRRVPDIAGSHHERMDGKGYPRKISAKNMSLFEKIIAVADVFEALTAIDRPYKDGKNLSQTLEIMARMVREQHLDPAVFNLVLRSGIYRDYAKIYLQQRQIDEVNIEDYLVEITDEKERTLQ